ncbi:NnrS family protein [Halovulum sp. GXIMD14794]
MPRPSYQGPAVFSLGFRPFFLVAVGFGGLIVPLWWLVWRGDVIIDGPFAPVDWHVHEMIFGYGAAVVAGFLFTAVPNWTGRMPKQGWPLAFLALLWIAGRVVVAGVPSLNPVAVAGVDCAFLLVIAGVFLTEILAGRNWRNLKVLAPLFLLLCANVSFHAEALATGAVTIGSRLGLAAMVLLIMLIGGRIVPSFTRNWLAECKVTRLPLPFGRFDAIALGTGAVALAGWSLIGPSMAVAVLLALAGFLHVLRLARWRGGATWRNPLLLMLHVAYAFVPLGLLAAAAGSAGVIPDAAGLHLLGIGAIAGMTLAVMMRATLGHTGRDLTAGPALTAAFFLVMAAALTRVLLAHGAVAGIDGITLAALLWTIGYAIALWRMLPWLVGEKVGLKKPARRVVKP